MKKRRIILGALLASAAIAGLASCGNNENNGGTTTPVVTTSGNPTTPDTGSTTTPDTGSTTTPDTGSTTTPDITVTDTGSTTTGTETEVFQVTFESNGSALSTVEVEKDGKVTKPAQNPTKAEDDKNTYEFVCWCKDEALTTEFDFENETITAATKIYAKWAQVSKATKIMMNGTEFASVSAAFAAIPTDSTETYTIELPKGTYEEIGLTYEGSATIVIKGNTTTKYGADVIIAGHGADMSQEKTRNLISIRGTANIILENLTLQNTWTRIDANGDNAQAEVLGTDTKGKTVAYNCSFKSNQDTLRTAGKAWFYGCYVEGDVDFLWMESAGQVALYENCEIVSVYDKNAKSHGTYFTAPRMGKTMKVNKGLVIFNSTLKQTAEAKENSQDTYLARNPWSNEKTYYNQVAYINTKVEDLTINANIWKSPATVTEFDKTDIGYKMDARTAVAIGYDGDGDILSSKKVADEYSGRETIMNRYFNTGKQKYEKDAINYWDINAFIAAQSYLVDVDSSKAVLDGEVAGETTTYKFDGVADLSALTIEGFAKDGEKTHYFGQAGSTITVPVSGKCYVEVYGYYSGTVETEASTQGKQVMFFNNGTTNSEIENDYIVYDESTTSVTITAKDKTYITKIVVTTDSSIGKNTPVSSIEISGSTKTYCVGVPLTLSAKVGPGSATNKSVIWSSSDEKIATINQYTGKVTFLTAGEVTFTATATDGSNMSSSITTNPIDPKWTVAEWYTTEQDNTKLSEEEGAVEIGVFDVGQSAYKKLDATYTFTNVSGDSISTAAGLKLNGSGTLSFATTKASATLTVMTIKTVNQVSTPAVIDADNKAAELLSSSENGNIITYIYSIDHASLWTISRGTVSKEINPILYAKIEYNTSITTDTSLLFGADGNYTSPSLFNITAQVADNGGNNSQVKNGDIKFKVAAGARVEVYANYSEDYTITLADGTTETHTGTNVGSAGKRVYEYATATEITITCNSGNNYFYSIKVTFPKE